MRSAKCEVGSARETRERTRIGKKPDCNKRGDFNRGRKCPKAQSDDPLLERLGTDPDPIREILGLHGNGEGIEHDNESTPRPALSPARRES
jgi:hypothetical protein